MTVQPDIPHKVSQIRHDLDDLYELMSQVEASQTRMAGVLLRHNNRFEELQQTLDLQGGRLDRIEDNQRRMQDSQQQLAGSQQRLEDNQQQLAGSQQRLEDNQQRLEDNQQRLEDNQQRQFEHLSGQIAEILGVLRGSAVAGPASESGR